MRGMIADAKKEVYDIPVLNDGYIWLGDNGWLYLVSCNCPKKKNDIGKACTNV